ncbi:MAG: trimethylamine methyltransferase family protein [Sporomusaceae bacterium]|nr:trimethylamine methyltransferase family protein [Sporomusaceae bacterium]
MKANRRYPFPGGLVGGAYKPLSQEGIEKIHKATMKVYEQTGIQVSDDNALKAFHNAGAEADFKRKVVRASESWIMDKIKTAPATITLYGREDRHNLELDGYKVYIGTGGTAPNALDIDSGERRPSTLKDVQMAARLVDALDNIHYFVISCFPNELPKKDIDVNRFYAAIRNTTKHVMGGVYTSEGVKNVAKYAAMIAGSREALLKKPFVSYITCVMSPLVMDKDYTELMLTAIETGLPLATPTAPMAGSTSPATLAGTLVQMNAEALSGVLLTQIMDPGHPVLYSCVPTTTDLRSGAFCFGSIEMGIMNAACAQLSRFYNLPNYTTAGVNEAKIPDIQSGYEGMASTLMCALAGSNYIHDAAGLIESGMAISYEQYVIDDDILGMCMRAVKGIEVSDDTLAVDVIHEVGPAGNYLSHDHTLANMKKEFFYNKVSDRNTRVRWELDGALDAREKARRMAKEILATHKPQFIDKAVEKQILATIPGIVQEWID